jgi:hypothetical protein
VIDAHAHPAFIALQIVDAIRNRFPALRRGGGDHEIVDADPLGRGINQAQDVGSNAWWRADLQPAAEAAVPLKK